MVQLNSFYRRLEKLEQLPILQHDIPPGSVLFPLGQLEASELEYVRSIPTGVTEFAAGYLLINLSELSYDELSALQEIAQGEFERGKWVPWDELLHRFLAIHEEDIPLAFEDAPTWTSRTGLTYHLTRTAYRAVKQQSHPRQRDELKMWVEAYARGDEL